jgi:DNA processing protein
MGSPASGWPVPDDRPSPRGWPPGFGRGAAEREALVRLASLRGIRPLALHALAWREGSAQACVRAIRRGTAGSAGDRRHLRSRDPQPLIDALAACGGRIVAPGDAEYVQRLEDLPDPPAVLFARGRPLRPDGDRVSIVGSRRCSPLGEEVALDLGAALAGAGVGVVSGAARGIDAAAHRGALAAGGPTVAVLGAGIDVRYPRASAALLERIAEAGTILSEYPPGTPVEPMRFPARNRIVVALGRALVVVEGAGRSGSMISVEHALELGRDVFAVPGPVTSPMSEVPLALIREGATMIRGADDLFEDLGIANRLAIAPPPDLHDDEARVYSALAGATLVENVAREAGMPIAETVNVLMRLELRGLVRSTGGRYERSVRAPG